MTLQLHFVILIALVFASSVTWLIFEARFRATWAAKKGKRNPDYVYLKYSKDDFPSFWLKWIFAMLSGVVVVTVVVSAIPFQPKYWFLAEHTGKIATLSNRFMDGTGDISGSSYTLTLEGDPTPFVVTDSRILGLKVGQPVDLTCSVEWVYGGADKNNCYLRSF